MQSVDLGNGAGREEVGRRLSSLVPDPGVVPFLLQNLVMRDGRFHWRINLDVISRSMDTLGDFPAVLRERRFDQPVRVIAGGRSNYVTHPDGSEFHPMFPRVKVDIIEQAGHWVHAEQQAAFLDSMKLALLEGPGNPATLGRGGLLKRRSERSMNDSLRQDALDYHRLPTPGKISVTPTKAMATQRDLGLAYSPGVAEACLAIVDDPLEAGNLTARNNLVAVITNGTAVLGLGNIGALAGKPVMEGKGCLFKKFAGIDVFDIELDELDPTS
jgi:hypothetical protein